ncbi:MAG: cupin domain-containing protein [Segniliparus sp.]|uniref:cupin domain-containing protein n=1 Tax=Segniliparus sp. TaxID=2804064 RepID=UPI003F3903AC
MRELRFLGAFGFVVSTIVLPPSAEAASHGVSVKVLSKTASHGRELIVEEVTFQPGASTGWHWHDGVLYGRMAKGELTHTLADCSTTEVYAPGDTAAEPAGSDNVHIGRNLGEEPAVQIVLVDKPEGAPDARPVPNPGCGFE